eukprot:scaffold20192_cov149-Isochrysis_galbana.AAC.1
MSPGKHIHPRLSYARVAHHPPMHNAQMVPASIDPFEPTAAELAGDDPAVCEMDTTPQGQVNCPHAHTRTHTRSGMKENTQ